MTKNLPLPGEAAAYGSLYMDAGEKMDKAEIQIREVSAMKTPAMWFFDIVCTPNQIPTGRKNALQVWDWIREACPDLKGSRIVVGLTTKDNDRPAQAILMAIQDKQPTSKILEELKLNDRRMVWVNRNEQK